MSVTQTPVGNFFRKFTVLRGAARELWIAFVLKFLNIAAYSVTTSTIVLWLSSEFGYGDEKASAIFGAWALTMTIGNVLVGSLTDALGMRRTFFLGAWICLVARAVMVFATSPGLALALGMFPLAIGEALGGPVLVAAGRKYSNAKQRSFSFSIIYAMMNIGFLVSYYIFDWMRAGLGENGHWTLPLVGHTLTTYRTLFLVSWVLNVLQLPLMWLIRPDIEVTEEGIKVAERPAMPDRNLVVGFWGTVRKSAIDTARFFIDLLRQQSFYRLLVFLLLVALLKLIFKLMDAAFPKFCIRELGQGAPAGHLMAINNWLIIFLAPLVGVLTQRFSAYRGVIIGGCLTAASIFIMALPVAWFQPLADGAFGGFIGHWYLGLTGAVHPYYVMIALFVIVLSFGEAFYSPRVYEYAAAIAPKGQEASYSALSYIPFLLAKLLVGTFSGMLLAKYCPAEGERHSATMWLIVAVAASLAPLGLFMLRKQIRVHEAGREE
jgi:MFS family permease